jgi:hypothetical protein
MARSPRPARSPTIPAADAAPAHSTS